MAGALPTGRIPAAEKEGGRLLVRKGELLVQRGRLEGERGALREQHDEEPLSARLSPSKAVGPPRLPEPAAPPPVESLTPPPPAPSNPAATRDGGGGAPLPPSARPLAVATPSPPPRYGPTGMPLAPTPVSADNDDARRTLRPSLAFPAGTGAVSPPVALPTNSDKVGGSASGGPRVGVGSGASSSKAASPLQTVFADRPPSYES